MPGRVTHPILQIFQERAMPEITDSPTGWVASHVRSYVRSNGKSGHRFHGRDALLLTTRGRKTGTGRRTALYYGRDGDRYLVVASGGGEPTHPSWFLNLLANPDVVVQVGAEIFVAHARVATAEEKPPLWDIMVAIFPKYAGYQAKTTRDIPVVILEAG
jgi:deazaflavin-dependent oxidoreductase (nitroreductase family)